MNKLDVIKTLEQDMFTLNSAAAAMYRIREPVGSTRLAFDQISSNKQARNRELALQTLTAVFEKFPEPTEISDPKVVSEFLAKQMYRTLSPRKSEQFPFDQRTPYARSYYRDTADRFLENFLLPLARRLGRVMRRWNSNVTIHEVSIVRFLLAQRNRLSWSLGSQLLVLLIRATTSVCLRLHLCHLPQR